MYGLAFSRERENRTHLSRIRLFSRSSFLFSSRRHCDSTFFVFSNCADFMFWKNPCWSPMHSCVSTSMTWRSKNKRLLHFALSSASYMLSWRPSEATHPLPPVSGAATLRASHQSQPAAQLPFRRLSSNLAWSPLFLGRDHQFSGPHDGCDECGFHVVHTAVSRRGDPEVPCNRCGHLLSKLGFSD